jgi:hypothetical protein
LKDIIENIKNMLEFPNIPCSQNAVTSAGNLIVAIHKMTTQTQITHEKQLVQDGK